MVESFSSRDWLEWATAAAAALALLVPLFFTLYGLISQPRDKRLTWICFVTSCLVALAWLLDVKRDTFVKGELETVKEELATAQTVPGGREFTDVVREKLIEKLRRFADQSAFVLANASDPETTAYARQIVSVLKDAGWNVPSSFGVIFSPVILPGKAEAPRGTVLGVSPVVAGNIGNEVLAVFQEADPQFTMGPHWPGTELPFSILVGPKPSLQ